MAADYPASLPVKTAAGADLSDPAHSLLHDKMYDEIVALATELSTSPKGTFASVKARLDNMSQGPTTFTPVLTASGSNPNLGANGSALGNYLRHGRLVTGWVRFAFLGTGVNAGTGNYICSLPVNSAGIGQNTVVSTTVGGSAIGAGIASDSSDSTNDRTIVARLRTVSEMGFTTPLGGTVASSTPFTWAAGDVLTVQFSYLSAS